VILGRGGNREGRWDAFLRVTGGELPSDGYTKELESFIDLCRGRGFASILDLGCGTGPVSIRLLEAGFHVRCVDAHEGSLRRLRERLTPAQRDRACIEAISFANLRIEPGSIDAVVAVRSINHGELDDVLPRFQRLASGLRDGGLLFLYVASEQDFRKRLGRTLCPRTTVPTDGPEEGIPHVFPSTSDLDSWMPRLNFLHRSRYEIRVPRSSPYFDAYSVRSRMHMRLRRMVSSHHTVLAEKIAWQDTVTEEQ
jgi:SAM-dependent methyltransferase